MKAFILLGTLIVMALLVLLIGPFFIDWTAYRTQFEAEASRALGQRVEVRGAASARLLPFPSVTFADVVVGEPDDPVLRIRSFRMDAELAPYLSGEIRIFDMRLDAPQLTLPIEADGSVRWPISTAALGGGTGVVLERVAINNGSALLEDRRVGQTLRLNDIDAQLAASSLAGPFSGSATLFANGEPLEMTLSTGLATADATLPVRLTAQSRRWNLASSLDAVLSSGEGRPLVDGRVQLVSPLVSSSGESDASPAPTPLRAGAKLQVAIDTASLTDMRIEVGPENGAYLVEGAAQLVLGAIPHFDLTLAGQAVDADRLVPDGDAGATFPERVAGLRTLLDRIPKPGIPGRVELSLPIVTVGDTDLRDVSFAGSPTSEGWSVETLAAELPGRSRLEASGIAKVVGEPSFSGSLLLAVRQPGAFFTWAGLGNTPELVRLTRAGLSAQVDLSASTQDFQSLELDLDGQSLNGSILRTVRPEGTATTVELAGGQADLGPLAVLAGPVGARAAAGSERYDIQFDAGPVTFGSYEAGHLAADFTLQGGTLDIADINADDIAGASVHATGTIEDLFGALRPDLAVDIVAPTPDRLLSLAADLAPRSPLIAALQARSATLRPMTLAGTLASPPGAQTRDLLLALSGSVGGTRTDLRLALENGLAAQWLNGRFGLDLALENADPAALLAQFGYATIPIGGLAPLRIEANLSGSPSAPVATSVSIRSGDAHLTGNGTLSLGSNGVEAARTQLTLDGANVTPWLTAFGISAGQPIDGLPVRLETSLDWSPTRWSATNARGSIDGSTIEASLSAEAGGPVSGSVSSSSVSARWVENLLVGTDDAGLDTSFASSLLHRLPFDISVRADRIGLPPDEARDLRARLSSDGSELRATELSATYGASRVDGRLSFRNVEGVVGINGAGSLRSWPLTNHGPLTGSLGVEVSAVGGGRTAREVLASLTGGGRLHLNEGRLRGISADVLAPITLAADSQSGALEAETVARLVRETADGAVFALGNLDLPFSLGAGAVRWEAWTVRAPEAALSGTVEASLSNGSLQGNLVLEPVTPEIVSDVDPPSVNYRVHGTLEQPMLEARTEALTSYFGVRSFQREQARVEALREELAETARLRREARLYRERDAIRSDLRSQRLAAEEAERVRVEEEARQAREAAAAAAVTEQNETARTPMSTLPMPDLSTPIVPVPQVSAPSTSLEGLPGVRPPERF